MDHVNLLIKPAFGLCGLRCRYCFYHDLVKERDDQAIMTYEMAELLIDRALADAEKIVSFSFQGGEPTLAGLDFFKHFVAYVNSHSRPELEIQYAMQTNGMLIDDEWAQFLAANGFLVGLSLDGSSEMHDLHRVDAAGRGTHRQVMAAARALEKAGVDFNILTVVTTNAARHGAQLYKWLKGHGFRYLQFIACLEPYQQERGLEKYALTPEKYGDFLCAIFDLWYADWKKGDYVSVRLFDDYVHIAAGMNCSTCASTGRCGGYLVAESNGDVYPCDFYVIDEWKLGNLQKSSFSELMHSDKNKNFIEQSLKSASECSECRWFSICRGGCRRDRQLPDGNLGKNYLCPALSRFFTYAAPRIAEIAQAERRALGR